MRTPKFRSGIFAHKLVERPLIDGSWAERDTLVPTLGWREARDFSLRSTGGLALPVRPDEQRALCGNDPKAATNQLLRSIDKAGVTVRNNELKKFEHNGAAKDDQENQAVMPAMADAEQKAQQRKGPGLPDRVWQRYCA